MGERDTNTVTFLRLQAQACRHMGSPFTGRLLELAAEDCAAEGPTAVLIAPWAEASVSRHFADATALRLAAALRDLALSGEDPALSRAYATLDPEAVWPRALEAMTAQREGLARFMAHEPQTNEVRRSIALLGGFLEVARATGLPLRIFEIAASAGLNLSWDRYAYRLDGAAWGDPGARVAMDTNWSGPRPALDAPVEVIERAACDRRPTDLTDPDQRRRLIAYIWPDQAERLARIESAIAVALQEDVRVEAADAVDWVRARAAPRPGAATVVYHSVFWTYMPAEKQAALTAAIEALGAQASAKSPFAWLSMEPGRTNVAEMEIRLRLWPGGDERLLGTAHPHAAWVNWRASEADRPEHQERRVVRTPDLDDLLEG